jgi:DNA-binding transcriptional LysR family regulator
LAGRVRRRRWKACRAAQKPHEGRHVWTLFDKAGDPVHIGYDPRLISDEFALLREAAVAGVGVAMLPRMYCRDEIERGELEVLLPQWDLPMGVLHAVFPRGRASRPRCAASSISWPRCCPSTGARSG